MAIDLKTLKQVTETQQVEMPEPFSCLMMLKPMTSRVEDRYIDMGGFRTVGVRRSGDESTVIVDGSSAKQRQANEWLMGYLIEGWQGFEVIKNGEIEEYEFSKENAKLLANDSDLVLEVAKQARRIAGLLKEEEEKN